MVVIIHREARREIEDTVAYYDDRAPGLGEEFLREFTAATDLILSSTEIGISVRSRVRRLVMKRFPYSLLYHPMDEGIRILAVMHHKRRPGYWEDRS